jgi:predicted TIM-barrel fold metal-dependent hydrolase
MKSGLIDNHVHIGVDPLFYLNGWSPYCLDIERLLNEALGHGIDEWVVFPFVSYIALDMRGLRTGDIHLDSQSPETPYAFENERLSRELGRLDAERRGWFRQFLIADPGRHAAAQVRVWEALEKTAPFHGIKIQPTIIRSPITSLLAKARCMLDFAAERNIPFLIHSSIAPDDGWSQCADILRVAEARPDVRFVLAHSCRFHEPSLRRVASLPNAWFDCSAHIIHCRCATAGLPTVAVPAERFPSDYTDPARVLADLASAYPEKLIWGSDAPFYSYKDDGMLLEATYADEAAALAALPPDVRQRIARTNTLAWLGGS